MLHSEYNVTVVVVQNIVISGTLNIVIHSKSYLKFGWHTDNNGKDLTV